MSEPAVKMLVGSAHVMSTSEPLKLGDNASKRATKKYALEVPHDAAKQGVFQCPNLVYVSKGTESASDTDSAYDTDDEKTASAPKSHPTTNAKAARASSDGDSISDDWVALTKDDEENAVSVIFTFPFKKELTNVFSAGGDVGICPAASRQPP